MQHNTYEFIEKVRKLAKRYDFEAPLESEGQSVGTIWKMRIDNAGVEVKITAKRCIITDEEGNSKQFDESQSEWQQERLDYIETLLKRASEHRE